MKTNQASGLSLALLMSAALLAGCSKPAEPTEPTAKFSRPGCALAAAIRAFRSAAPTLLPMAIDNGA